MKIFYFEYYLLAMKSIFLVDKTVCVLTFLFYNEI
jgi:hypothetical protein